MSSVKEYINDNEKGIQKLLQLLDLIRVGSYSEMIKLLDDVNLNLIIYKPIYETAGSLKFNMHQYTFFSQLGKYYATPELLQILMNKQYITKRNFIEIVSFSLSNIGAMSENLF